jgi:hypothetical protein
MMSIQRAKLIRGRHSGFPSFNVIAGGLSSLPLAFGLKGTVAEAWGGGTGKTVDSV